MDTDMKTIAELQGSLARNRRKARLRVLFEKLDGLE